MNNNKLPNSRLPKNTYRSHLLLLYELLKIVRDCSPIAITHSMYKLNMTHAQFNRKLRILLDLGCLDVIQEEHEDYNRKVRKLRLSEEGRHILSKIDSLNELMPLNLLDVGIPYYNKRKFESRQQQKQHQILCQPSETE